MNLVITGKKAAGQIRRIRLFFGPRPITGIFLHEVTKCFRVTRIHNNILVYGSTTKKHIITLPARLRRAEETGVRLKVSKSTFSSPEVKWFGRVISNKGACHDNVGSEKKLFNKNGGKQLSMSRKQEK